MTRTARYIFTRVLIGLLIGIGLFYFRAAHAQTSYDWVSLSGAKGPFSRPDYGLASLSTQGANPTFQPSSAGGGAGQITYVRKLPVKAAPGGTVDVIERIKVAPPVLAKAARALTRASPAVAAASIILDYYQDDKITLDNGQWMKETAPAGVYYSFGTCAAAHYNCGCASGALYSSRAALFAACAAKSSGFTNSLSGDINTYCSATPGGGTAGCVIRQMQTNGLSANTSSSSLVNVSATKVPATDADLEEAWRNGNGDLEPDPFDAVELLGIIHTNGVAVDLSESETDVEVQPSTISQPTSRTTTTTTNPDGTTTTTTTETSTVTKVTNDTAKPQTFAEQAIKVDATTRTTVTENGQVKEESETERPNPTPEEEADQEQAQDLAFTDPAFPAIEIPYEQRYPDGIVGVWNTKKSELTGSQFVSSVAGMFPSLSGTGSCPQWRLPINFSFFNYGMGDVSVACWIWDVVGLLMITFACFAARDIIFGRG